MQDFRCPRDIAFASDSDKSGQRTQVGQIPHINTAYNAFYH